MTRHVRVPVAPSATAVGAAPAAATPPASGGGPLAYLRAAGSASTQDLSTPVDLAYDEIKDEWGDGSIVAAAVAGQWELTVGGLYIVSAGLVVQNYVDAATDPGTVDLWLSGTALWSYWGHEPRSRAFVNLNETTRLTVCSTFHIPDDVTGTPKIWAKAAQTLVAGLDALLDDGLNSFITITRLA